MSSGEETRPFRVEIPERELVDLRERLTRVRWAPEPAGSDKSYGVPAARVRALAEQWRDHYDWRSWESRINAYPQFTTTIDGANVHFLHVRSPEPGALPLILTHGWPGSIAEFLGVIGPLTDPRRHGGDAAAAFHLVVPSLPGSGFSGPTPDTGWGPLRIARAWAVLMRRLGYRRYGTAGNDWGACISPEVGRNAPDEVIGTHVTQVFSLPDGESPYVPAPADPPEADSFSPDDRKALAELRWLQRNFAAYHHVHAQNPQTLAHALNDSPAGLLAWNSQCMGDLDPDVLLTHVSIHWLTGTAASAIRIYAEDEREQAPAEPTTVPLGLAQFRDDAHAIRAYADRDHANIISWNVYDTGGHYAGHQAADLLVTDIRRFFSSLTGVTGRARSAGQPTRAPAP